MVFLERILIRNLPAETTAALRALAINHHRSLEAEVREIITDAVKHHPTSINDLLSMGEGADLHFEPKRVGLSARTPEL